VKIGSREIGGGEAPYIVCEIGANHMGSLDRCLETMEAAKRSGADACKLQAYTAETITLNCDRDEFFIKDGPWKGKRLWDLYKKCETPFEWFPWIAEHAKAIGIEWFASVFDPSSVDMLEKLKCPAYKIASFEITDIPLIRYAARTGKPVILSTGMANQHDILKALGAVANVYADGSWLGDVGTGPVVLHCVSGYPAKTSDYNLGKMRRYSPLYGVSDHTLGLEVPIAATALGACMVEKHFRLEGVNSEDEAFSLQPAAFARMVKAVYETWSAMQESEEVTTESVHKAYRRSLFVVQDIKKGEVFSYENVRSIRPGHGWPPDTIDKIVGNKATRDIERGEPLKLEMFERVLRPMENADGK